MNPNSNFEILIQKTKGCRTWAGVSPSERGKRFPMKLIVRMHCKGCLAGQEHLAVAPKSLENTYSSTKLQGSTGREGSKVVAGGTGRAPAAPVLWEAHAELLVTPGQSPELPEMSQVQGRDAQQEFYCQPQ